MFILLHGEDIFRAREKLNEIISQYEKVHKSGLNLKYFTKENFDLTELKGSLGAVSMFKEKRLIIFNNLLNYLKGDEKSLEFFKENKPSDDLLVFFEEGNVDKRTSLFVFLKKNAKVQEFTSLEAQKLSNWVEKQLLFYGGKISQNALSLLISFVGNNLWQMDNEIKKLINFRNKELIRKEDVELLIKPKIETNIFKTIDALALRDKKSAIAFLHKHLATGETPPYLFSMINYQFRNLIVVKDLIEEGNSYSVIAKSTKLHPFVAKKTFEQAKKFSLAELKKIYRSIFEADVGIKTGKIDPKTALDLFVTLT